MKQDLSDWLSKDRRQRRRLAQQHTSKLQPLVAFSGEETLESTLARQRRFLDKYQQKPALPKKDYSTSSLQPSYDVWPPDKFFPAIKGEIPDEYVLPTLKRTLLKMGFDISNYKEKYLKRRLRILLRRSGSSTYSEYLSKLRRDPLELERLKRTFSINVTRFFRNFDAFWVLYETAFPELFSKKRLVKIWSAGCAMGPEPYTLAMLVDYYRAKHPNSANARILATDINPELLTTAVLGEYPSYTLDETPPLFQSNYFEPIGESQFRVKEELKHAVKFKQHDLLSSASAGKHHIIVCRNVLIYFSREQQAKIYGLFYDSLIAEGFLLLGGTETLPLTFRETFEQVSGPLRLYQRRTGVSN
ncbi:MAG: CheR family methyltransferase [Candidatus Thorarchaeota archaeon]